MQHIDTRVGSLNEGTITVEFRGEGGELVTVQMAADSNLDREAAVLRARELMVQLTTFAVDRDPSRDEAAQSESRTEGLPDKPPLQYGPTGTERA